MVSVSQIPPEVRRAMRAETLEEAARVAARMHRKGQIGEDIAAAIRALILPAPEHERPRADHGAD